MSGRRVPTDGTIHNVTVTGVQTSALPTYNSFRVPRPDPPLLPSIIFPLGPPFCGDERSEERRVGKECISRGQQAGSRVRKRRREGNEWAARVERRYTIQRTIRWLKYRWKVGPQFSSSAPPRPPTSTCDYFPFGPRHSAATSAERNVRSGAAEFFP